MTIDPRAGKPATSDQLIDVDRLLAAYDDEHPDPTVPAERVSFGTSGHRGSSLKRTFNEDQVLAITEAICRHRAARGIDGPLFLGIDTHALSGPAAATALEVLAAHGVDVMLAVNDEYTPTPVISHAILHHNRGRARGVRGGLADGIVMTPSHNPPADGGYKYNPPNGGPADTTITHAIEVEANHLLESGLREVKRIDQDQARRAATTHYYDYIDSYVGDLPAVIDMELIRDSGVRIGIDPLGGAGVHYWAAIAERHEIDLTVVSDVVDPQFGFMTVDWDGQIRMDPSSKYAMQRLIGLKDKFDVAAACDTDHDRHGIVVPGAGLLSPNHYLAVAIDQLLRSRPEWSEGLAIGKTVVTSAMIDRVVAAAGRRLFEVPVGFKWFAAGLHDGELAFGCEESAGASFLRRDGQAWSTDKDGIIAALLAAEITGRTGRDPGKLYTDLTALHGEPAYDRIEAPANVEQRQLLKALKPDQVTTTKLAGEPVEQVLTTAPGNGAPIGGIKVMAATGWFAARPSGTEDIYKIYGESFRGEQALKQILDDAQQTVNAALSGSAKQ